MMDSIARSGSFAAAAREMGKVPSALTYSVRQLEEALDVLLFDRSSRQAVLTAAGHELLTEGRRLLQEMDAVANRVKRVATGWESELTIAFDDAVARRAIFDLMETFYQEKEDGKPPPTRLKLRTEVLSGTWEALISGQADLAIGTSAQPPGSSVVCEVLGPMEMVFCVAPHHPLADFEGVLTSAEIARHRIVAVADTARSLAPMTVGVVPGQEVLTVPSMATKLADKIKQQFGRIVRIEGLPVADWVLIDADDVIIHLFRPEVRTFYNLERMWAFGDEAAPKAASPGA